MPHASNMNAAAEGVTSVPEGIKAHGLFFDHLVELVPVKYYYDEGDKVNLRFLAKGAKVVAKQQMKLQYKANKKAKFDPSAPRTILEVQQQKAQTAGQGAEQLAGDGPSTSQPAIQGLAFNLSGGSSKREELLARLHAKVEEQRKAREAKAGAVQQAKDWRNNALQTSVKQKQQQQESAQNKKRKADEQLQSVKPKQQVPKGGNQQQQQQQGEAKAQQGGKSGASVAADFAFGRIELDEDARRGGKQQQKRPSKEILLKQAESKKAQLEALAGSNEGKAMAQNLAWKTALGRAKGDKVLDDPKLLRKSLKKDAKQKEKSSAAWRERVQAQTEGQQARQEKRTNNLQIRKDTKLENKKAKREKKLLRAGFEGRKQGFIGGSSAPAGGK